jgi:glutathione peroxidase
MFLRLLIVSLYLMLPLFSKAQANSIYSFTATDIDGKVISFSQFKGKKLMIVNTASKCGLTPQFKDLETLFEKYKDRNFIIVGFPTNNFGRQDPGSNQEIKSFCEHNYGVSFPMMQKIAVKGKNTNAIYQWLKDKKKNGVRNSRVKWNFQKYLIDEEGHLVDVIAPWKKPGTQKVLNWLEKK